MADVEGDLSDFDIHRIMEALQSRQAKTVAQCALSIKVLLNEIQQQLLDLMVDSKKEFDGLSDGSDVASDDPNDLDYRQYSYKNKVVGKCKRRLSLDESLPNEVFSASVVPITGTIAKTPPVYPCNHCNQTFNTKKALSRHITTHEAQENANQDNGIKAELSTPEDKYTPLTSIANSNQLSQPTPPKRPKGSGEAKKRVTCEICGVQTLRQHMARHMLKHSGIKPFKCEICDDKFARKDKYNEHLRRHNEGKVIVKDSTTPKEHTCRKCGFKTEDKEEYKAHQKTHPAKNLYRCEECNKEFTCPSHLEQHNIKHRNEKPFMCDHCGVSFSREPNLARHIRSHITPAPFCCKFCQKPYHRHNELVVHERTHTGEKPYVCEICGNAYAATKYLKRHLFTHTGLKPFKCDICSRAFSRQENMRAHRKIHDKSVVQSPSVKQDALATAFHASQNMDSSLPVSSATSNSSDTLINQSISNFAFPANSAAASKIPSDQSEANV